MTNTQNIIGDSCHIFDVKWPPQKKSLYIQKWYYDTSNDQPGIYAVNVDGFMTADNAK